MLRGQVDLEQAQTSLGRERPGHLPGCIAVLADAKAQVQAVGLVAELEEDVPHGQRVLAP